MMEENKTDRNILAKGLKTMGISLGAMFLGPTLVYIALTNQEKPLYIPILILAIIICLKSNNTKFIFKCSFKNMNYFLFSQEIIPIAIGT